jgi:hypothetical protein
MDELYKELELQYVSWSEFGDNLPLPETEQIEEAA